MYVLVTVGYETEREDGNGAPRIVKSKYPVEAESIEEAILIIAKYVSEDTRSSQILATAKMPIECVIDQKNTPQYYKS